MVEQAAAAATSMEEQANNLNQAVSIIKVDASDSEKRNNASEVRVKPASVRKPAPVKKTIKSIAHSSVGSAKKGPAKVKEDDWEEF